MSNEARHARGWRARLALACALTWLCLGAPALAVDAKPSLVLLSSPATLDGFGREALSRLEGELRGAEFEVIRRELEPGSEADIDPRPALERACREQSSEFALALAPRGRVLQLWLYDGVNQHLSVQDWPKDDPHAASVLAVQGVELLRAQLATQELSASVAPVAPAAPEVLAVEDVRPPQVEAASAGLAFGVELGLASAHEGQANASSWLALARVSVAHRLGPSLPLRWAVRISAAGLGSGAELQAPAGHVRVVPSFLLADLALVWLPVPALSPFVSVGVGASRWRVEGEAEAGFYARSSSELSALGAAGIGVLAHPWAHWGLCLQAQGLFATEPTTVRVDASELATFGGPSLLLSAALVLTP